MNAQFFVTSITYLVWGGIASFFASLAVIYGKRALRIPNCYNGILEFKTKSTTDINKVFFILSALVILLPLVFTDKGIDRPTYVDLYRTASWQKVLDFQNQEPGFSLINLILHTVFGDGKYVTFIFFYSLMVFNVYYVIYKLRDNCSIPLSVFIFSLVYCIQSISLMRIYVAGSILLTAAYYLLTKKKLRSFVLWLFASSIHYTALLFVLVYFIYACYNGARNKYRARTVTLLVFGAVLFVGIILILPKIKNFPVIERYQHYFEDVSLARLGLLQPILYIPLIALAFYMVSLYGSGKNDRLYMANIIPCFLYAMMSYMVTILGRSFALFMYPFIIGIPYVYKFLQIRCRVCEKDNTLLYKGEHILPNQLIMAVLVLYVLFKYVLYMYEYIEIDGIGIL